MSIVRINHDPSPRQLRTFALLWGTLFAGLSGLVLYRHGPWAAAFTLLTIAVFVPAVGWFAQGFLRLVYLGMSYTAFPFGYCVSHLCLLIMYYAVLTPVGLLLRAFRHDPLQRRFDRQAESYWVRRAVDTRPDRYFRQF